MSRVTLTSFVDAPHGLGERQLEIDAQVGAARLARAAATAAAEEVAEQIAERGEDVLDVREAARAGPHRRRAEAVEAVAIVDARAARRR